MNTAVIPEQRDGFAYKRFLTLREKVQQNQGSIDLFFIGDSITQRWETDGQQVWETYFGHFDALQLGIEADRTQHVLGRLDNGQVDGLKPAITILLIGTNNSGTDRNTTEEMLEGVRAVTESLLHKLPRTELILMGIFPRGRSFNEQRGKITQMNQVLRLMDGHERIHYLDIGSRFVDANGNIPEELMPDALHLSEEGYRIWAEELQPLIEQILSEWSEAN